MNLPSDNMTPQNRMMGKIYLVNVGANAAHGFASPVFDNRNFEFLPIPEKNRPQGKNIALYRDLRSFYDPNKDLLKYIPSKLWDEAAHYDPEFDTFTYGDNCSVTPRSYALKQVRAGDYIFFLCRLQHWNQDGPTQSHGFYLVGFLHIQEILKEVKSKPSKSIVENYKSNAHVRLALTDPNMWNRFWVFRGSSHSQRFNKAVPIHRDIAKRLFTTANGSYWKWNPKRTDLQIIGSYTRSCRCIIDPLKEPDREKATLMWKWVWQFSR